MTTKADVWQGTLALMVLKTLHTMGPQHGYGIARRIERTSAHQLVVNYGTLYPALLKLEQEGYIRSDWGVSENNRKAKFYALTRAGRKQLAREAREWEQTTAILARFLTPNEGSVVRRLRAAGWRLAELFARGRRERELAAELHAHLQHHIDDNVRAGMTAAEAQRHAVLSLGGVEQTKEAYRDRRGFLAVDTALRDLQYAARVLRRNPGFAAVGVLTLALGIGANTAIFSIVNAVLLRPLPFPDASRLVQIFATDTSSSSRHDVVSYPDYEDWRAGARAFERMSAFVTRTLLMSDGQAAELLLGARVAPSFFDTLGVHPALGRAFRTDEDDAGKALVVVLTDGFWKRHFGGDPRVLGSTLRLNDETHTIIGVMPDGFRIAARSPEQVYVPLVRDPNRGHGFLSVVGRLRAGTTQAQAQAELDIVARRLAADYPKTNATNGVNVMPLVDAMAGPSRAGLLMLLGVVGLVLLIACTNVANLLLARGAARQRELRVRAALGAGRGRLIRQLLTESVLLACMGGALGLLLAQWTGRLLVAVLATGFRIPRIETAGIDGAVLAFTLVVALATGVLFGVAPALSASSPDLADRLHESSRSATGGVRSRRVRHALVIAEFAMALVLLGGAGTLLKTLLTMRGTEPGFQSDKLVVVDMWLPQPKYSRLTERRRFFDTVVDQLRTAPAVRSAALVANLPLGGGSDGLGFHIAGRPDPLPERCSTPDSISPAPTTSRRWEFRSGKGGNSAKRMGRTLRRLWSSTKRRRVNSGRTSRPSAGRLCCQTNRPTKSRNIPPTARPCHQRKKQRRSASLAWWRTSISRASRSRRGRSFS